MIKVSLAGVMFLVGTIAGSAQVTGFETNNYEIFTMPRSSFPSDISNSGTILASGNGSGFVVKNGVISPLVLPVADLGIVFSNGLNEGGDIVGEYRDSGNNTFPFTIIHNAFQILTPPGGRNIFPSGINQHGVIVGSASRPQEIQAGFILTNGNYSFVECPGNNGQVESTVFSAINSGGTISGWCIAAAQTRGFTYRDGTFSFLQYPGSESTRVWDINKDGDLVGDARIPDAGGTITIAFLYRKGVFHDVSFPGTRQCLGRAINDQGKLLGSCTIIHVTLSGDFLGFNQFNFVRSTK